jgi:hypothetical protein
LRTPEVDTLGYEYLLNSISKSSAMNLPDLDSETIDRIIEMAWEDRTPFEAIEQQARASGKTSHCFNAARNESV